MRLHVKQIPYTMQDFQVKMLNYFMQRLAHRLTANIPAPFPEDEIFRTIAERIEAGELVEFFDDTPLPSPEPLPATPLPVSSSPSTIPVALRSHVPSVLDLIA